MLHYAIIFFVVALIAAVLGQRGVAGLSAEIGYQMAADEPAGPAYHDEIISMCLHITTSTGRLWITS